MLPSMSIISFSNEANLTSQSKVAVESKALNIYRFTGRFSCIPQDILTKKLRCKLQSVQIVIFHIVKGIYLRLRAKIMENVRLFLSCRHSTENERITHHTRSRRKFDFVDFVMTSRTCTDVIQPCSHGCMQACPKRLVPSI